MTYLSKTVTPDRTASLLELALDYKQGELIERYCDEAIEAYLEKERLSLMIDGEVNEIHFTYQLKPRIDIILNGTFYLSPKSARVFIKAKRIVYNGSTIKLNCLNEREKVYGYV